METAVKACKGYTYLYYKLDFNSVQPYNSSDSTGISTEAIVHLQSSVIKLTIQQLI